MDLLSTHFNALTFLFGGAICAIVGVYAWAKGEFLFGTVMGIVFGAYFIIRGLLDLTGLTVPGWVSPSIFVYFGIVIIWRSISGLYAEPAPSSRRRTHWWFLAIGMGAILLAIYEALQYYWR